MVVVSKDHPFIQLLNALVPGESFTVPASSQHSFVLNLDSAFEWDGETNLLLADEIRAVVAQLNSITDSLDEISIAWNGIDDDEENEVRHRASIDNFDDVHDNATTAILNAIEILKDIANGEMNP